MAWWTKELSFFQFSPESVYVRTTFIISKLVPSPWKVINVQTFDFDVHHLSLQTNTYLISTPIKWPHLTLHCHPRQWNRDMFSTVTTQGPILTQGYLIQRGYIPAGYIIPLHLLRPVLLTIPILGLDITILILIIITSIGIVQRMANQLTETLPLRPKPLLQG